jgi:hypothetical protein
MFILNSQTVFNYQVFPSPRFSLLEVYAFCIYFSLLEVPAFCLIFSFSLIDISGFGVIFLTWSDFYDLPFYQLFPHIWPLPVISQIKTIYLNFSNFLYFLVLDYDFWSIKESSNFLCWLGSWTNRSRNNKKDIEMHSMFSNGRDNFGHRFSDQNGWKRFNAVDRKSYQRGNSSDVFNNKYNNKNYISEDAPDIGYGYGYKRLKKGKTKIVKEDEEMDITEGLGKGKESLDEISSLSSATTSDSYYFPVKYKGKAKEIPTESDIADELDKKSLDDCSSLSSLSTTNHSYFGSDLNPRPNTPTCSWEIIEIPNNSIGGSGSKNKTSSSLDSFPEIHIPNSTAGSRVGG